MSKGPGQTVRKRKFQRYPDRRLRAVDMVRIRVYDGKGRAMGNLDVPAYSAYVWLSGRDATSTELAGIREIVDPEGQNESYDWDIWARPAEVKEDLGPDEPKADPSATGSLLGIT